MGPDQTLAPGTPAFDLRVPGFPVSKKNRRSISRSGKSSPSWEFQAWRGRALVAILEKCEGFPVPIDYPLRVEVLFVLPDLRVRDLDNAATSLFDCLQDAGVLSDDRATILSSVALDWVLSPKAEPFSLLRAWPILDPSANFALLREKWGLS